MHDFLYLLSRVFVTFKGQWGPKYLLDRATSDAQREHPVSYPTADTVARIRKLKVARRSIIPEHYVNFTVSYLLLLYYPKFCPVE
jgi:hypothetical protein